MSTMRALRFLGPGLPMELQRVPRPGDPGPGEAILRVEAAGLCHTELHFLDGLLDLGVHPVTLGHEVAGTVEAVGPDSGSLRPGDRAMLYYYLGCGSCPHCRRGEENLCPAPRKVFGFVHDGGFQEAVRVPARNLVPLPPQISFEQAAPIGCSVTTALHAARRARLEGGEWAVVYGTGAVGFGLVQMIRLLGGRAIAVGRTPRKLAQARELGAEAVIDASQGDVAARIRETTGGRGADVVFELVGTSATMEPSLACLARKGRLVFIGYSRDQLVASPLGLVVGETTITASVGNTLSELYEAVDLVARGSIRTIVERQVSLEDVPAGLEEIKAGRIVGRLVARP
jgi:alcohol dehydrogenase, propanol-preferring